MKKIVLSTLAALTIYTVSATAEDIKFYKDTNGQVFTTPAEGRVAINLEEAGKVLNSAEETKKKELPKKVADRDLLDRLHLKADLRLRYENKEYEYSDGTEKKVNHNRYRLRLVSAFDLTDSLKADVGMRSGFANPTSGNQTFEDDENLNDYFFQSLRFNILGFTYASGNSTLKVGRQPYIMYRPIKSQLIWDNDVSLDGVNYQYKDDENIITFGVNQTSLAEASISEDEVYLYLAQYVRITKLENSTLKLGAGFYYYDGVKGNTSLYNSNKGSSMGNTMLDATGQQVSKNGVFANDYRIAEGFAELNFKDVFGKPFAVAAEVAYNTAVSDKNFGYDLAVKLGKAKKVGDWQIKYSYTDLEADAVLGAHSDSDNFGGGTAAKGHAIRTKYKFGKHTYLAGTWFFNERFASKDAKDGDTDYTRTQQDVILKF